MMYLFITEYMQEVLQVKRAEYWIAYRMQMSAELYTKLVLQEGLTTSLNIYQAINMPMQNTD